MLPLATAINLDYKPDGTLVKRLTAAQVKALQKFGATVRLMEFYTREATPDEQAKARATALAKELEAQGSKPSASQTGTLPVSLEGDIPADAASAQDIVFLEVVG
jgi:hypothetical protein